MRTRNMEQCECDRCGAKEFLTIDSPNQANWHDLLRVTVDGNQQPFQLCQGCLAKYRTFMNEQDSAFNKFMGVK